MDSAKPGTVTALLASAALALLIPAAGTVQSCAPAIDPLSGVERVEVTLPAEPNLPDDVPAREAIRWTVTWLDGNGERRRLSGVRDRCGITLERGIATAVIARPDVTALGAPERAAAPVGAVYPADARASPTAASLVPDATGAIAAQAFETIMSMSPNGTRDARLVASRVNWGKFRTRVASLATPGLFDYERFSRAALSGRITASSVSARPSRELVVAPTRGIIAPGSALVPEWPGGEITRWGEGAGTPLLLPDGLARFLADDGWLTVSVTDGKVMCAFYEHYSLRE